ncbi:hypothetical protein AVEN_133721-1 [Araneus ventricosus]|uniref:Uncharacterized protein n=1 Tax=Araneus ventricosus TaxID=182803 RepID=A0A4Y2B9R3_ARAVE|nr:hypothetical protein AVEN_133721-1 [Araneus ventricosus]
MLQDNKARNVVHRLWNQSQQENSVRRKHVSGGLLVTIPSDDRYLFLPVRRRRNATMPFLISNNFPATERRTVSSTVRRLFMIERCMHVDYLSVFLSSDCRVVPVMLVQRARHLDQRAVEVNTL